MRGKRLDENDLLPNGKPKPASAFKRKPFPQPDGSVYWRTDRPKFREALERIRTYQSNGLIGEHIDRMCRDPRDEEDLLEIVQFTGASIYSLDSKGKVGFRLTSGGSEEERRSFRDRVRTARESSEETSRRIKISHREQAETGRSSGGRLRAYGWKTDRQTPVQEEQDVIGWAAGVVLAEGNDHMGFRGAARQLNAEGKLTVTGGKWTGQTLKRMLLRHRNAGIPTYSYPVRHTDPAKAAQGKTIRVIEEIEWLEGRAPEWAKNAPLDVETFRRLQDKAARQSEQAQAGENVTSNTPRWLVSYIGLCQSCDGLACMGRARGNYLCVSNARQHPQYNYNGPAVDALVSEWAKTILARPEAAGLRAAPPAVTVDTGPLRVARNRWKEYRQAAFDDHRDTPKIVTKADRNRMVREADAEIAKIDAQLAAAVAVMEDPLAGIAGHEDAGKLWDAMTGPAGLLRQRAIIDAIMTITFLPGVPYKRHFDPALILIEPKQPGVVPWDPPELDAAALQRLARGKPGHADRISDWLVSQDGPRTAVEIAAALESTTNKLAEPMLEVVADGRVSREWAPGPREQGGRRYLYRAAGTGPDPRPRTPLGYRTAQALAFLADHPGSTATEVAAGISAGRTITYDALRAAVVTGTVRQDTGWRGKPGRSPAVFTLAPGVIGDCGRGVPES